jgi:hypothetical protein
VANPPLAPRAARTPRRYSKIPRGPRIPVHMASNSLRCRSREDYPGAHGAIQRSSAFADQLPVLLVCLDPLAGPRIPGNGRPHIRGLPSDRELSRHRQILPDFAQTETTELGSFPKELVMGRLIALSQQNSETSPFSSTTLDDKSRRAAAQEHNTCPSPQTRSGAVSRTWKISEKGLRPSLIVDSRSIHRSGVVPWLLSEHRV